jgi:hypothetical protein
VAGDCATSTCECRISIALIGKAQAIRPPASDRFRGNRAAAAAPPHRGDIALAALRIRFPAD